MRTRARVRRIGIVVVLALVASACGWTQSRFDAGHTGNNPFEQSVGPGSVDALQPSWAASIAVSREVLVQTGRAFAQDGQSVRAFEAATGRPLWSAPLTPDTPEIVTLPAGLATARTAAGQELVISGDRFFEQAGQPVVQGGQLVAYDAPTGAPVWQLPIQPWTAPVVVDQTLYVTASEGATRPPAFTGLVALDVATGTIRFRAAISTAGSSLAVAGGFVVVGTSSGFEAVPAAGCGVPMCTAAWRGAGAARFGTSVAVSNGRIFVASGAGLEVYPATGCGAPSCGPTWTGTGAFGSLAIADGRVFATGELGDPTTLKVFAENGCGASVCAPVWRSAESSAFGIPTVANGLVYAGTTEAHGGNVFAWPAAGCQTVACSAVWSASVGGSSNAVTVADGRVYAPGAKLQTFTVQG